MRLLCDTRLLLNLNFLNFATSAAWAHEGISFRSAFGTQMPNHVLRVFDHALNRVKAAQLLPTRLGVSSRFVTWIADHTVAWHRESLPMRQSVAQTQHVAQRLKRAPSHIHRQMEHVAEQQQLLSRAELSLEFAPVAYLFLSKMVQVSFDSKRSKYSRHHREVEPPLLLLLRLLQRVTSGDPAVDIRIGRCACLNPILLPRSHISQIANPGRFLTIFIVSRLTMMTRWNSSSG